MIRNGHLRSWTPDFKVGCAPNTSRQQKKSREEHPRLEAAVAKIVSNESAEKVRVEVNSRAPMGCRPDPLEV